MLHDGELGIHPAGALGVAFYVHAHAECLIGRGGEGITQTLKKSGVLKLLEDGRLRQMTLKGRITTNLLESDALNRLPELIEVCCNPNQLDAFTTHVTRFLENLAERGRLRTVEDIRREVPILLILPNGILFEQSIGAYEERLQESRLMGRLPTLNEKMVAALLDRVVRGISLQAGGRRGNGADAVYVLERKGTLVFAGGGKEPRHRIEAILTAHDYPFKHACDVPGTRIEFDKAMISIVLNVGGLIHTVKPTGELIDLRMGDLCKDESHAAFVDEITRAVFHVGQAAGAYPPDANYQDVWAGHLAIIEANAGHVTSSLKMFRDSLRTGLNTVKLFTNEEWLLTPLAQYAARTGLKKEEALFKTLRRRIQQSMALAIRHRDEASQGTAQGNSHMKLAAQRNIGIEIFESGPDDMILIGTMLDEEHLIKLEMNIYLPDEQITRSRLDMVRVPFPVCREVASAAERLVGLRIERGVVNEISERVGGRIGCSHIKELATSLVYFAASYLVRRRIGVDPMGTDFVIKPAEERFSLTQDLLRGSCLAYCQTTPQGLDDQIGIKRIGEEHTHPIPLGECEPSLGHVLKERAERWRQRTYIRYYRDGREHTISWSDFARRTFQVARHLMNLDVRRGDRICMISENRFEMFIVELAAMSIGAVSVPVFAGYHPPQIAYVLRHARPRFVMVSGRHQLDKIDRDQHPWIEQYYCMDFDEESRQWGALDLAALTGDGGADPAHLNARIESVMPDDLCFVMYTSGTTGPPKGVCLTHYNIISQQLALSKIWNVDEKDVLMNYLPWHHSFGGLFERFLTLYQGCVLCLDDSRGRDMDRLIENWKRFDPTLFFSVPRVHELIVTRCREDRLVSDIVFGRRLRFVFTAGAPLPDHVQAEYQQRNIPVLEGWGLTETSPCVTITTYDQPWRRGYVGFPIPGVRVRIDSNQEILVNGPNVMQGYLDDEEATSHVMTDDRWFRTGDLGEFTPNGLRVFGRKDGAFKLTTGEKVHPLRIENVLINESPYIQLALVLGSGKDFVAALIYPNFKRLAQWAEENNLPKEGITTQPAVRDLYARELERINPKIDVKYHRIRRAVLADHEPSLERGEMTPTGKLVRKCVCDLHKHKISALFSIKPAEDVIEVCQGELQRA